MYLNGIGTATPPARYTKAQCWEALQRSPWYPRLDSRSIALVRLILRGDNGIEARRLALDDLDQVFTIDPDTLHRRFSSHAPELAAQAGRHALQDAGLSVHDVDAVIVSTCTGYLCPGLSGYVAQRLGLRRDLQAYDLVGQGCAAALPNMALARALLASDSCRHALSVCVEVSSSAMYLDDDPGVLVSACLFGDGAGAAVLSREPLADRRPIRWVATESLLEAEHRDALRFEQRSGMLRNILTRQVPSLAAEAAHQVLNRMLRSAQLAPSDISTWILHAGGRDVLSALQQRLELDTRQLRYSAEMLREFGNLSSAFIYFVLQAALTDQASSGPWWLCSFGAGFACHGALLQVD